MPSIRNMPKWLVFLLPITLSLTLLGVVGCSGNDKKDISQPVLDSEAGIANITVNRGTLDPPYSDDVRNYGVGPLHAEASDFSITVTLKSAKAKLTINGDAANSGAAFPVAFLDGKAAARITVEAEDSRNSNIVFVTASVNKPNTTVYIYDSIGGNLLDGDIKLTLRDSLTNELLEEDIDFPVEAQGAMFLGLDKTRRYNIYARRPDTAEGCFADFDPSRENSVRIISRKDWVKALPASAPIVTDVSFAANGSGYAWQSMPPGANYIADTRDALWFVKVTVIAESNIYHMGNGMTNGRGEIMVNIDDMPFSHIGQQPWSPADVTHIYAVGLGYWNYANEPVVVDGKRYVMTDFYFNLGNALASGEHFLGIVVYDWANNRTEQKVYLNVTSAPQGADVDISSPSPTGAGWYYARARTYGMPYNGGLYSTGPKDVIGPTGSGEPATAPPDPVGPNGDTVLVQLEYNFMTGYRGWELRRALSPDGPFEIARRRAYATPATANYINVMDTDPGLVGGVTYYYYIRFFNNISSYTTSVFTVPTLPSFNVNLVSPPNQAVSDTLRPTFRFNMTSAAPLNSNIVDYGRFTLYVRDKIGAEKLKARFNVDYRYLDEEGNPEITINWPYDSSWYNVYPFDEDGEPILKDAFVWIEDNGAFVIDTNKANELFGSMFTIVNFEPGVAYEWDIFGDQASGAPNWGWSDNNSMYFRKNLPSAYGAAKYADSYSSYPDEGLGALNGYFTLIMNSSAK